MKNLRNIDLVIDILFQGLLVLDISTELPAPVEYFNYGYIFYFIVRVIVLIIEHKKKTKTSKKQGVLEQWGNLLGAISSVLFFVVAIMDMY